MMTGQDEIWAQKTVKKWTIKWAGMFLGLHPANERRRYFVTSSLIGGAQA